MSKVLERIIASRIDSHLKSQDILSDEQFGFRKGHSANHQLIRIAKSIKKSFVKKESTGMLGYDVEKAFDSVWYKGLIYKLIWYKFPMYITKMVKSFLTKGSSHVSIDGSASKKHSVITGVPQGSVLSPILYNIFMSDLIISYGDKGMFADDTSVQKSSKNPKKIVKSLTEASKQLADFCARWKIRLNGDKTQASFFTKRRAVGFKTLGMTFDKRMTYGEHTYLTVDKSLGAF